MFKALFIVEAPCMRQMMKSSDENRSQFLMRALSLNIMMMDMLSSGKEIVSH